MNSVEVPDPPGCIVLGSWFHISPGIYALISLCVLEHKGKVSNIVSSHTKIPAISKVISTHCIFSSPLASLSLV